MSTNNTDLVKWLAVTDIKIRILALNITMMYLRNEIFACPRHRMIKKRTN